MIINALYKHYETLLNDVDSGVSRPGYSKVSVGYCLVLSKEGRLIEIIDLWDRSGNRRVPRRIDVPEQVKRSSTKIAPNFMYDNCTYVLGLGQKNKKEKKDRISKCFQAFAQLHKEVLDGVDDEGAVAFIQFLREWDINSTATHPVVTRYLEGLTEGNNVIFGLEGSDGFIHQRKAVTDAWDRYRLAQVSDTRMQCLVTGQTMMIARLHPKVKGVTGLKMAGGTPLVSCNWNAFESYGKKQSFNAPVSEEAAFGYATALNYLLSSEKHRVRIGDTTTVFWAERSTNGLEEDLLGALFFPVPEESSESEPREEDSFRRVDPQTVRLLYDIFRLAKAGKPVKQALTEVDASTNFFILGLAPNASRLAVRFWHVDSFGTFVERIAQHYRDMAMVKRFEGELDIISVGMILKETAPLKDTKRIAPLLGGVLIRSILVGAPYPMSLYSAIISRIRADQEVNYVRAAVIKACLVRKWRVYNTGNEEELTVALNERNLNTGYLLGRLFALLEKVQEDANPGINSTIRDKYFGAASTSPGSVFPILLRLAQHHISKAEYGGYTDKRIEGVISSIDRFPAHLSLEDQGQFVLGYYQQRQAVYAKSDKKGSAE